jgi:cyclophilin family peptidyl-prolyl cis-trans isomerase/HEAT repeat protein
VKFTRLIILIILITSGTYNTILAKNELFYEVLVAADHRNVNSPIFNRTLASNDKSLQEQSLLALGRIGKSQATLKISPFLYSKEAELRAMAAFSLGISTDVGAHKLLAIQLKSEKNPQVLSKLLIAIGNLGDAKGAISSILPFLNSKDTDVVSAACDGLSLAWTFHRDKVSVPNSTQITRLLELSQSNANIAEHCLFTLSRLRREPALFDINLLKKVAEDISTIEAKILALRIMAAMNNINFLEYFVDSFKNSKSARVNAEIATAIAILTSDKNFLSSDKNEELLEAVKLVIRNSGSHVKVNLINALILTKEQPLLIAVTEELLNDQSAWVRNQALTVLFSVIPEKMNPRLLALTKSKEFQAQAVALNILRQHQIQDSEKLLTILAKSAHKGITSIATRVLKDENADAEEEVQPRKSAQAIKAYEFASKKMNIKTSRGDIIIQLLPTATFTSSNFYQLAKSGFYDGLSFHRVVPNFVVQGGDPESTGQGGPGFSIREELSMESHLRGTLGMATSGKDTGGSQFFFNNSNNIHLNNNYTVFAKIIKGIELIDSFEVGDSILSIKELSVSEL